MEPYKEKFELQLELYKRLEAYQYFNLYLNTSKLATATNYALSETFGEEEKKALTNFSNLAYMAFNSEECKIFEIDPDLKPMLEDTKPNYDDLHLPYPAMFVSQKFEVGHFMINGFLLIDVDYFKKIGTAIEETAYSPGDGSIRLLCVILNTKREYEFYSIEALRETRSPKTKDYFDTSEEYKDMKKAAKLVSKLACNLVQTIINDEKEIEQVTVTYTKEHNSKRISKGKAPFRNKIILRLGGTLKRYAQYYSEHRGGVQPRHIVMGHYRRFLSERYKAMRGKKVWIFPFWVGLGDSNLKRFVEVRTAKED